VSKWGWHYEEPTQAYVYYSMEDGEAKAWIAAEVAESVPSDFLGDSALIRLIERVKGRC
jgi:hypothetical protein